MLTVMESLLGDVLISCLLRLPNRTVSRGRRWPNGTKQSLGEPASLPPPPRPPQLHFNLVAADPDVLKHALIQRCELTAGAAPLQPLADECKYPPENPGSGPVSRMHLTTQ